VAVPRLVLLTKACLIALVLGATVLSVSRPLVMRLFPTAFAAGEAAYDPLVLFFLLVGTVGVLVVRLNLVEKPRLACLAWAVGAAVNVAAAYLLIPAPGEALPHTGATVLRSAAWAGVAGVATALAVCAVMVRRERLAVDAPTFILIIAGLSTGFGWEIALPVSMLLILVALTTTIIFSVPERAQLRAGLVSAPNR
jgi:O-antigen/teichoic acid export membrane protein